MQKKYGLFFEQILLSFISNFFAANGKEENNLSNLYRKLKTFFKVYRFRNFSKAGVPKLGYMYSQGYISTFQGVH